MLAVYVIGGSLLFHAISRVAWALIVPIAQYPTKLEVFLFILLIDD